MGRCLRSAFVSAVFAAGLVGAAGARADGLPVLGIDVGPVGVVDRAGEARYVTMPAGRDTVVARVQPDGGRILASALVKGTRTIPAVAYDGSASGLSADGRTLVLIEPRLAFPRATTTLAVLDTRRLRVREVVRLRGDFSFDAVSPRGALLYLVQYVSPADPTRYRVRAYDTQARRLLRAPVVDPAERGEAMRGAPLTRVTSPDGRWAYTLYDGGGKTPFVHALDTARATARCVDLDALAGRDLSGVRLDVGAPRGAMLTVRDRGRAVASVDTRTFRVSAAAAVAPVRPADGRGSGPWVLLLALPGAGLAAAGAVAAAWWWRRRVLLTG